jgi:hypothetical protein
VNLSMTILHPSFTVGEPVRSPLRPLDASIAI